MVPKSPFEVPESFRELAEKSVAQARAAYGQFMDAMAQERAIRFARQNGEAGFALATELANAKNIQDMLAIQSRYAQTQMQAYALQAQELGRLIAEATQSSVQPRG